jgi:GDPmannose 4,6-dehydratase
VKTALILGVSGQDGAYLARSLLDKGYTVCGGSRDAQMQSFANLVRLGIRDRVTVESVSLNDFRSVIQTLDKVRPDEVYNLSGQSSVGLSFEQPVETLESIAFGTLNLLEAIRFAGRPTRLYNAGSSECFGDLAAGPADETTPFRPRSPYAVAKAAAFWEVANYREAYDLYACSGILFNHESSLRPVRFVTRKVIVAACRIAAGSRETLHLGDLGVARDWGWAPEYVEAMWRMLQQDEPGDYVVATGETHSLQAFVEAAFARLELDWRKHVVTDASLARPNELRMSQANPEKAHARLDWKAKHGMRDVVRLMIEDEGKFKVAEQLRGAPHPDVVVASEPRS